ncbi:acyl carrier protein [Haloferula sp. A504]|uniref:acyl carrier protein n=1 Tax=Haloferula sp. A504 TaxID=3373601 RepID=UPI0031CB5F71|nr:acyl carrier protein [Verrucomicrobiaceae bacterium E54]
METELAQILREEILDHDGNIGADTDLFEIGLDSMAIMQLQLAVEERFSVTIDPADLSRENFQTPEAITRLIKSKQA